MTLDLFDAAAARDTSTSPLADRIRPKTLDEVVGQDKILGEGRALRRVIERGEIIAAGRQIIEGIEAIVAALSDICRRY